MSEIEEYMVTALPTYEELEKRVEYLKTINSDLVTVVEEENYIWAKVENGAGDEGVIILMPDNDIAAIYGYDHESDLNFYDEIGYDEKQKVFNDFPTGLKQIIESKDLRWSFEPNFTYATAGFWLENNTWNVTKEYAQETDWGYEVPSADYVFKLVLKKEL